MPTYPGDPDVTLAPDATHEEDGYATSELRTGLTPGPTWTRRGNTLPPRGVDRRASGGRVRVRRAPRRSSAAGAARGNHGRRASRTERPRPRGRPPRLPNRLGGPLGTDRYRDHPYLTAGPRGGARSSVLVSGSTRSARIRRRPGQRRRPVPPARPSPRAPRSRRPLSDSLPIVENLCGLDGLPAGFRLYAFPPASGGRRVAGASGRGVGGVTEVACRRARDRPNPF